MNINWYPRHMVKAKKQIKDSLKLVDAVIELLDARIPYSSQNPDIKSIVKNKPRIIGLNKSDLALESATRKWINYFKKEGINAVAVNSVSGKGIRDLEDILKEMMKDKLIKNIEKGRIGKPIRVIVLGIPNVGKSSFINRVAGKAVAAAVDKPGVTRTTQWVKTPQGLELMDTPGVLWPKFAPQVGLNLAFTGAIQDEIVDNIELAVKLIEKLKEKYSQNIVNRYKVENLSDIDGYEVLKNIGIKRGCLNPGGKIDLERAARLFLDEFREGKLGEITLEDPEDFSL